MSTAHGCWMLDLFVSDIKLQAIYKVIHTSNYDGHISKYASKKREITQIKCWRELSSLVNRTESTLSTSVLSFKLIVLIVIAKF
jgi:hypothetical protein